MLRRVGAGMLLILTRGFYSDAIIERATTGAHALGLGPVSTPITLTRASCCPMAGTAPTSLAARRGTRYCSSNLSA